MRYRTLAEDGDYVFGRGVDEILVDSPATVAQAVRTRLLLATGEWFLDESEGTPYEEAILGTGKQTLYDAAIQDRILGSPGVTSIDAYASFLNDRRQLQIACTISTQYGGQLALTASTPQPGILDSTFVLDVSTLG